MKQLLLFYFAFILSFSGFGQTEIPEKASDSTRSPLVQGKILVVNVGFAPVSAFSFDSPLAIGFLSIKKHRFRYEPDFALGLNGKPWMNSNWFRYDFFERKNLRLHGGLNAFLFFKSDANLNQQEFIQVQRSLTFESGARYQFSSRWSLNLVYQYNNGCDLGTLSGSFIDLNSSITGIPLTKKIRVAIKPQLFYFDFNENINGLFTSTVLTFSDVRIPLSIYVQGVLPLWTDFPGNNFKWNMGLECAF